MPIIRRPAAVSGSGGDEFEADHDFVGDIGHARRVGNTEVEVGSGDGGLGDALQRALIDESCCDIECDRVGGGLDRQVTGDCELQGVTNRGLAAQAVDRSDVESDELELVGLPN